MAGSFIDTNMFVSLTNKRDRDHKGALQLFERIRKGEFGQPHTSDYVFDEALTVILIRTGRVESAINVGKIILGSKEEKIPALARLIRVDERIFAESWRVFRSGKFKELSFTDHTILSQIKEYRLDYLISLDSGFDGLVARIG